MKYAKKLTAIVLGCSLLFFMCSCSNVPAKAEDDEINESSESETEETEDDTVENKTEDASMTDLEERFSKERK